MTPSPAATWTQRLRRTLLAGLFVTVPFGLTLLVVLWFVRLVDQSVAPFLAAVLGRHVPGLGLVTAFIVVLTAGWAAGRAAGQVALELGERVLDLIPGFNWVYRTFKQIFEAFSPDNQVAFRQVVLVEYPRKGAFSLGFVTRELETDLGSGPESLLMVYVPTNHFYLGDYILFRKDEVRATELSIQQGIQCALSAGAAIPDRLLPPAT